MKITFLGGADEVGASCALIEIAGKRLLVDAGIRISPKPQRDIDSSQLPDLSRITELGGIDYVLVTHAHTDHTGALPLVLSMYPDVPVLMTRPTEALVRVLQQDAQRIMASHYEAEGELPLYDEVAVSHLMEAVTLVEYNRQVRLGDGLGVTFHVSGHIAGAAMLVLDSVEGTLVMSGDVSHSPQRTVNSVRVPRLKADVLVLESTYGGRMHANREAEERRLIDNLKRVVERGGRVLIPAFALGRAQEVLQIILAYRDELNAPVYVDGMVRSVCEAYARFQDVLPEAMVRAAKDQPLFFRRNIQPVASVQQRNQLAMNNTPCVIVASSGMLTGGASQFYAQHLLGDERSAIFLTGYQDEEAPGKMLQRLSQEQAQEGSVRLGKQTVSVRAEIGTYSLSAHADESALIAIARALKPEEVLLVHGDASARQSLADALRQRQIAVALPHIGSIHEYSFAARPWALVEQVQTARPEGEFDTAALWEQMQAQAGSYYSAEELSQRWYGTAEHARAVTKALEAQNGVYFSSDWKKRSSYRVNTAEHIERALRQRAIISRYPDMVGRLAVYQSAPHELHVGIVREVSVDGFVVLPATSKGNRYTADKLIWLMTPEADMDETSLLALREAAAARSRTILSVEQRHALASGAAFSPDALPGIGDRVGVLAVLLSLSAMDMTLTPEGVLARPSRQMTSLEQNEARAVAVSLMPPESRLRRVGLIPASRRMTLVFDFPDVAAVRYQAAIEEIGQRTGWLVTVDRTLNQEALLTMAEVLLPAGAALLKRPSYYVDKREVTVEANGLSNPAAYAQRFFEETGVKMRINETKARAADTAPTGTLMEVNAAYARIRAELQPCGLYRVGVRDGVMVLYFITPQKGAQAQQQIDALRDETGYPMHIHEQPNQQAVTMEVRRYAEVNGYNIVRGPSLRVAEAAVAVRLASSLTAEQKHNFAAAVESATGYRLEFS